MGKQRRFLMNQELMGEIHVGSNCEVKVKLDVKAPNVKSAIRVITSEVNLQNLEELIPVEDFSAVITEVEDLKVFEGEVSREYDVKSRRIKNMGTPLKSSKFTVGIRWFIGFAIGIFLGSSYLRGSLPSGLLAFLYWFFSISLIFLPILGIVISNLLINKKISVPEFKLRYPNKVESINSEQLFEVVGHGFVQMFIDCADEAEGIEKAKHALGLNSTFTDGAVALTHYISISHLRAIYQCDPITGNRISDNLISFLGRKLKHSYFIFTLWGFFSVLWKWFIPCGVFLVVLRLIS